MAKTLCRVSDTQTAESLRGEALAAGMVARVDHMTTGILVTIDHPEERRSSAEHLTSIHGLELLTTGYRIRDSSGRRQVSLDIASGFVAEERGISIEGAQAWLQSAAERAGMPVVSLARAIILGGHSVTG
jgi:hypothetical protein